MQPKEIANRAFLYGDAVSVYFFLKNGKLILTEECYFFLMASMRKMRMHIPLSFTLEFFVALLEEEIDKNGITEDARMHCMVYREHSEKPLTKAEVAFFIQVQKTNSLLKIQDTIEVDVLREISVNTHMLSNIYTHSAENIYAEIYAKENDLQEVILINPNKRIARGIHGNFLFLEGNIIKIPKQSEGAYISPMMENLVTFIHKNRLAEIEQAEMNPFESQKAEEVIFVSDQKGIFSVSKIRNKIFESTRFQEIIQSWENSFNIETN